MSFISNIARFLGLETPPLMSKRSKSAGLDSVRPGVKNGRSRSGGNGGSGIGAKEGRTKSGGSDVAAEVLKEEEHFLEVEKLQELIDSLKSPPNVLTWEDFRDKYNLECGNLKDSSYFVTGQDFPAWIEYDSTTQVVAVFLTNGLLGLPAPELPLVIRLRCHRL
ncbi:hypothetical protein KC19_VG205600 [Ceratodon purpureus]|uniref:Uncharacterized protein n=1 Tax=Ceratodon purpureus TaxID=3225 RepID=A0A8T0HS01_CERPU|nr:hypothetical protein KC19_VG205600 [Ceratodon purpureus]